MFIKTYILHCIHDEIACIFSGMVPSFFKLNCPECNERYKFNSHKSKSNSVILKKNSAGLLKLQEIQQQMGLSLLKLKQECPTRWNSCWKDFKSERCLNAHVGTLESNSAFSLGNGKLSKRLYTC